MRHLSAITRIVKEKKETAFVLLLLLLNLLLKGWYLTSEEIGLDEPFTIYHSQFSFPVIIEQLKSYNNPPLFELILHAWISIFGISPLAVRMLPLLFAAFAPVALFYFSRLNFSWPVAIVSSLLLTFSNLLIYYSHDCRVYSLFVLLTILNMHFYSRVINKPQRYAPFVLYALSGALLIYAHYFGFFVLFIQTLHLILFRRYMLKRWLGSAALILTAYLPQLYVMKQRMNESVSHGTWLQPPGGAESLYNMIWSFSNYPLVTVCCILILVATLVKLIVTHKQVRPSSERSLILLWFLFPFFGMYLISFSVPMYISRYLIYVLPAYYILLALSAEFLFKGKSLRNTCYALIIAGFAVTTIPDPDKKQPLKETMAAIADGKKENAAVVVRTRDFLPTLAYHYNRHYFSAIANGKEYQETEDLLRKDNIFFVQDTLQLRTLAKSWDRLLYLSTREEGEPEKDAVFNEINKLWIRYEVKRFGDNWRLYYFKK